MIITAERIAQWFTSARYPYGTPVNAEAIAPALDAALMAELQADHTPALFNMDLSATIAHVELFGKYLAGQYDAPAPVWEDLAIIYDADDNDLPPVGATLTGSDAMDMCWHLGLLSAVRENLPLSAARTPRLALWTLTFTDEQDEDTYQLTRIG